MAFASLPTAVACTNLLTSAIIGIDDAAAGVVVCRREPLRPILGQRQGAAEPLAHRDWQWRSGVPLEVRITRLPAKVEPVC